MLRMIAPPLLFMLILAMALASIWTGLNGPFLFDDYPNLENLAQINGQLSLKNIGNYIAVYAGSPGRPLSALSFLLNDYAWPSGPFSFKYTNVLIHLINGLLVYWLLNLLSRVCNKLPNSHYWPVIAAAIWVIHPLQISAQLLVVQRMTLLSTGFILLGCIAYLKMLPKVKSLYSAFLVSSILGIFTILAFLCKENGLLLPVFILVLNSTFLHNNLQQLEHKAKQLVRFTAIIPSTFILLALIIYPLKGNSYALRDFNVNERLLTQVHVIGDYLKAILLPRLSGSGIYFDDYPITRGLFTSLSTSLLIVCFVSVICIAWLKRKSWPVYSFSVLWFFGGHLIESTTIPLELYFEHRNYLPLLGPVIFITASAFNFTRKRSIWISLLAIWASMLLFISHLQSGVWGNVQLLSTIWAEEHPKSVRAIQQKAMFFESNGLNDKAFITLYEGHKRVNNGADLILGALALACSKPVLMQNHSLYHEALNELKKTKFSYGVTNTTSSIGRLVINGSCPSMISEQRWLDMTQALLDNTKVASFGEDKIRIARANFFIALSNHNQAIRELEASYAFKPTIEIARDIGYGYYFSGNEVEALRWLRIAINTKQPLFEKIMSSDKEDIQKVISAIEAENR